MLARAIVDDLCKVRLPDCYSSHPKGFEQRQIFEKKKKSNPLVNKLLFLHHTIYPNSFLFYTENKNKNIDSINLGNFLEVNFNFSQIYIKNIPPFLLSASSSLSTEAVTHTPNS